MGKCRTGMGRRWQRQIVVDGDVDLVADIGHDEEQDDQNEQEDNVREKCGQPNDGVQQH